jgi:hypothetical protein
MRLSEISQHEHQWLTRFMAENDPMSKKPVIPTFKDFAMVRLLRPARGFDTVYPIGSVGTVVDRQDDGVGYTIEFDIPKPGVAPVTYRDIEEIE